MQFCVMTLLGGPKLAIHLVHLVHQLQALTIQGLHILLHLGDDNDFCFFVSAEVDEATQDGSEPLGAWLPKVLEVEIVNQIDHGKLP